MILRQLSVGIDPIDEGWRLALVRASANRSARCFARLDLNQGTMSLIGMYCEDVDNPGPALRHSFCLKPNSMTEAGGSAGSYLPSVAGHFA